MLRQIGLAAVILVAGVSAVAAKETYAAYEGPDAVQSGRGGTKVFANGIDYWTSGAPAIRFQVLGILYDSRTDRLIDRDIVGSKAIAREVLAVRGDAVILAPTMIKLNRAGEVFDPAQVDQRSAGFGFAGRVHRRTRQLAVIRYLDRPSMAGAPDNAPPLPPPPVRGDSAAAEAAAAADAAPVAREAVPPPHDRGPGA